PHLALRRLRARLVLARARGSCGRGRAGWGAAGPLTARRALPLPLAGGGPNGAGEDRDRSRDDHLPEDATHGPRVSGPMRTPRPSLVVTGQIVVMARPDGLETAEAIGIADGAVVTTGSDRDLWEAAAPDARLIEAGPFAVVPGLHDFHLHLVGMARARRTVDLEDTRSMDEIVARVASAARTLPPGSWVLGDGWHTEVLKVAEFDRLESAVDGRPALLKSHDRHSAWSSSAAMARAGIADDATDPPGGRFERDARGRLNGLLRESAADRGARHAARIVGEPLDEALREVAQELSGQGITGVTDAGDPTDGNGNGPYAALGDSFSSLAAAERVFDGRLRATLNLPADAVAAA